MKLKKTLLLALAALTGSSAFAQNPIIRDQFSADPTARVFNGKIYLFPSHDIPAPADFARKDWFCMADYHVFSSENLTDWTDHGVIVSQENVEWGNPKGYSMWAPDCVEKDGKYYFIFPNASNRGFANGVAEADLPEGPYTLRKTPIEGINGIDPCVLQAPDGKWYIYWGSNNLMCARLNDDFTGIHPDEPVREVEMFGRKMKSVGKNVSEGLPGGFKEGTFVFYRNGKYYLTYPWVRGKDGDPGPDGKPKNNHTETLAYAMGDSPYGPFEYKGLIMKEHANGCWTNHHSIVEYKDQWYLFYHHNDYSPNFDKNRSVCCDSLFFNEDGTIQEVIPTLRGVGLTDARKPIQIDRYSKIGGNVTTDYLCTDTLQYFQGWSITYKGEDAYSTYSKVDFGQKDVILINVRAKAPAGAKLVIKSSGGAPRFGGRPMGGGAPQGMPGGPNGGNRPNRPANANGAPEGAPAGFPGGAPQGGFPGGFGGFGGFGGMSPDGYSVVATVEIPASKDYQIITAPTNRSPRGVCDLRIETVDGKEVTVDWIGFDLRPELHAPLLSTAPLTPWEKGGFETGKYRNVFAELGYSQKQIDDKLQEMFDAVFTGPDRVYFEVGKDEAIISDVKNHDARTEGMSYGMMIAVQLNKKDIFDRLWRWSKNHMQMKDGRMKGYFAWTVRPDGTMASNGPASDGELYFITSLIFASNRWGNNGEINYLKEAQYILDCCTGKDGQPTLFDPETKLITFVPGSNNTDASYHVPAFLEVWAKWANDGRSEYWQEAARLSREYLHKTMHPITGLNPDQNNYDGTVSGGGWGAGNFRYDSWRVPMNIALDYSWSCADREWQTQYGHKLQNFLYREGVDKFVDQYELDGKHPTNIMGAGGYQELRHTPGFVATAAALSLVCSHSKSREFIDHFWNNRHEPAPSGYFDAYYEGLMRLFAFMHLSGNYRVIEPAKAAPVKTAVKKPAPKK